LIFLDVERCRALDSIALAKRVDEWIAGSRQSLQRTSVTVAPSLLSIFALNSEAGERFRCQWLLDTTLGDVRIAVRARRTAWTHPNVIAHTNRGHIETLGDHHWTEWGHRRTGNFSPRYACRDGCCIRPHFSPFSDLIGTSFSVGRMQCLHILLPVPVQKKRTERPALLVDCERSHVIARLTISDFLRITVVTNNDLIAEPVEYQQPSFRS
jgi:hypothetical protein